MSLGLAEIMAKDMSMMYKLRVVLKRLQQWQADKSIASPRKLRILQRHSHVLV